MLFIVFFLFFFFNFRSYLKGLAPLAAYLPEFSSGAAAAAAAAALGVRRFGGPIHPTGRLRYIPLNPLARYTHTTQPVAYPLVPCRTTLSSSRSRNTNGAATVLFHVYGLVRFGLVSFFFPVFWFPFHLGRC